MARTPTHQSQVPLWSDICLNAIEDVSNLHCIRLYTTAAQGLPFLWHEILKNNFQ